MEALTGRILTVEDDPLDQALILERLRSAPYLDVEVHVAGSIAGGKALMAQTAFDLVLLDYRLPDGSAERLLDEIHARSEDEAAQMPDVLMLSGLNDLRVATRTIRAGAIDFLSKNALTSEELPRAVQAALVMRAHRAERRRLNALEMQLRESRAIVNQGERNAQSTATAELSAEQITSMRIYYREFMRNNFKLIDDRTTTSEPLTTYIYQQRIPIMHLIRVHTAIMEELIEQEPVMAQRAVAQGRLALIRILLSLVQRYQRNGEG